MKVVLFWSLVILCGFGFALAVQMRVMVALVLRRALKAYDPAFADSARANTVVVAAASGMAESDAAGYLADTYPHPLRHLRLARRASLALPVALLVLLVVGRFSLGVI